MGKASKVALKGFRPGKWLAHFEKHGAEMGFKTSVEYLKGANAVFNRKGILRHIRRDGRRVFCDEKTNEFVVTEADGTLVTYFKPKEGNAYWEQEIKK